MTDQEASPFVKQCPPHRYRGVKAVCELCGEQKGTKKSFRAWAKRTLASHYQCDAKGCRAPHGPGAIMYQHGHAFLCEPCHEAHLAAEEANAPQMCVICGQREASEGKLTCGNASEKCAKALKRRTEREANKSD